MVRNNNYKRVLDLLNICKFGYIVILRVYRKLLAYRNTHESVPGEQWV